MQRKEIRLVISLKITNDFERMKKKKPNHFICILKPMQNFKTNAKKRNQISHFIKITKDFEKLLQYLRKYTN